MKITIGFGLWLSVSIITINVNTKQWDVYYFPAPRLWPVRENTHINTNKVTFVSTFCINKSSFIYILEEIKP